MSMSKMASEIRQIKCFVFIDNEGLLPAMVF